MAELTWGVRRVWPFLLVLGCSGPAVDPADWRTQDEVAPALAAECRAAPAHAAPESIDASLRPLQGVVVLDNPPLGLDCGLEPGVVRGYARVRVPTRADLRIDPEAGFSPRVAVAQAGCASELVAAERLLGCTEGLPLIIEDLRAGTELLVVVGVAADDPALTSPAPGEGEFDPLSLRLDLSLRNVVDEGQPCDAQIGRCESGTSCVVELEGDQSVARCRPLAGDDCASAIETQLLPAGEVLELEFETGTVLTDAHVHACTGWRRPERVLRLVIPAEISPDSVLSVAAAEPRVGLAMRAPSCLPEHAQGCAAANPQGEPVPLVIGEGRPAQWATQGIAPLLFIELPTEDPPPTISLSITLGP